MQFRQWLEMSGDVLRHKVPMDEADIEYLNKFPVRKWTEALKQRYNDHLREALDSNGEIRPDYSDIYNIKPVVAKLKHLGFDIRNTDPTSDSLVGMKLMTLENARDLLYGVPKYDNPGWIRWSGGINPRAGRPKKGEELSKPVLKPGFDYWKPNHNRKSWYGFHSPYNTENLEVLKPEVSNVVDGFLSNSKHLNVPFLVQKRDWLVSHILWELSNATNNPQFNDPLWRKKRIYSLILLQLDKDHGIGTVRQLKKAKALGIVPSPETKHLYAFGRGRPNVGV